MLPNLGKVARWTLRAVCRLAASGQSGRWRKPSAQLHALIGPWSLDAPNYLSQNHSTNRCQFQAIILPIRGLSSLQLALLVPLHPYRFSSASSAYPSDGKTRGPGALRIEPHRYTVCLSGKNSHTTRSPRAHFAPARLSWIPAILFILLSVLMIPYAGVQDDESLFALPFWEPMGRRYELRIFHQHLPLMLMSYLGTLKTALYWPLFKIFGSGIWVVRLPMVLVGAVTVYFFYKLLLRCGSRPVFAAASGAFLLATDPTFVLTDTFDWGPVALEHLLLVAGCYLLVRFQQSAQAAGRGAKRVAESEDLAAPGESVVREFLQRRERRDLAAGFLLFGLALWNKALFVWALSGLTVGALAVFWPEVRRALAPGNLRVAAAAFLVGASPFLLFNLRHSGATASENMHLDPGPISRKWIQFENAANGNAVFGFILEEDYAEHPKPLTTWVGRIAGWIHDHLGAHRRTGFVYAFAVLLLLAPWWWKSRAARFSLVFIAISGGMMTALKNAGGAAHHTVLLWPFPQLFAAVAIAAIPWRWIGRAAAAVLIGMNLLVLNQHVYQFARNGAAGNFTDALFPLAQTLTHYRDQRIWSIDWGIFYTMDLAGEGRLPLRPANDLLMSDTPSETERTILSRILSYPDSIFVGHVPAREEFRGVGARLQRFADSTGYHRQPLQTVFDSNGRPVFEIFRFVR
jgi:4-amino-4-deoxy-L-arabinose transferase-like glycosyltransferase